MSFRERKINILVKARKNIRCNTLSHHEIPKKKQLQQIASNHLSDIDFKDYIKEPYSFLVNDTTLP